MTRQIHHLIWATRYSGEWPPSIPRSKPRGFKALGLKYEVALANQLPCAERGIWWEFKDSNGLGLCQTDFLLEGAQWAAILECKHTWTPDGMAQLHGLYLPVVAMALNKPTIGVQVCKHIVPWAGTAFNFLPDAMAAAKTQGTPTTLHWRGLGPLSPPYQQTANPQSSTIVGVEHGRSCTA